MSFMFTRIDATIRQLCIEKMRELQEETMRQ